MEIKTDSKTHTHQDLNTEIDYQPVIDLFELLLEWDMKDVQDKKETNDPEKYNAS